MSRGPRRMPSMKEVQRYYGGRHCFRCGQSDPRIDRAHLIDRSHDGLDVMANLRPLCYPCHKEMPSFYPGDEDFACAWVGNCVRPGWEPFLVTLAVMDHYLDDEAFAQIEDDVLLFQKFAFGQDGCGPKTQPGAVNAFKRGFGGVVVRPGIELPSHLAYLNPQEPSPQWDERKKYMTAKAA